MKRHLSLVAALGICFFAPTKLATQCERPQRVNVQGVYKDTGKETQVAP